MAEKFLCCDRILLLHRHTDTDTHSISQNTSAITSFLVDSAHFPSSPQAPQSLFRTFLRILLSQVLSSAKKLIAMPRQKQDPTHRQDESNDGDEEVQQAPKKQQPKQQNKRTARFKKQVSEKVGLTLADLDEQFEGVETAHNFWRDMQQLITSFHGPRCSWMAIKKKLDEAQTYRQGNNIRGVSSTNKWQPWDIKRAKELLSNSVSRSSTTEYRIPQREGDPDLHVLFCPIGTPKHLRDDQNGVRCIQVIPGDRHSGSMLTSVEDKWGVMEQDLGPGMVFHVGLDRLSSPEPDALEPTGADARAVWAHSVVAAILWAETKSYISAEFHSWEWFDKKIRARILDEHLERHGKPLLIFLHLRRPHWREKNSDIWADINYLYGFLATSSFNPGVRFYPNIKEVLADCDREWGMRALEAVAKKAPPAFSWRPKVCFGDQPCSMPRDNKVLIRRGSKTGPGTTFHGDWDDPSIVRLLPARCQESFQDSSPATPLRRRSGRVPLLSEASEAGEETSTFHQELVSTLETWGEIVVFMVGEKILYTLMVTDECTDDAYRAALTADTCLKDWRKYGGPIVTDDEAEAKEEELHEFCRWWRSKLLDHDKERFESLEVGVRLDIGISEASPDGKFFIHEVTRWTGADFYASHPGTSPPYDYVPRQLGIAFGQQFASWREGPDDEAEEEAVEETEAEEDEGMDDDVTEDSSARKRKRPTRS